MITPTMAAKPVVTPVAIHDKPPTAPILWKVANKLPATTLPMVDWMPAAILPATTPAVEKPAIARTFGTNFTAITKPIIPPITAPTIQLIACSVSLVQ